MQIYSLHQNAGLHLIEQNNSQSTLLPVTHLSGKSGPNEKYSQLLKLTSKDCVKKRLVRFLTSTPKSCISLRFKSWSAPQLIKV